MNVGDRIRIARWGGTWTVTAIASPRNGCPFCCGKQHRNQDLAKVCQIFVPPSSRKCPACGALPAHRRVFALATEGTRIVARECACEVA